MYVPNAQTCGALLFALTRSGQWEQAVQFIMHTMPLCGVSPNAMAYREVIQTCGQVCAATPRRHRPTSCMPPPWRECLNSAWTRAQIIGHALRPVSVMWLCLSCIMRSEHFFTTLHSPRPSSAAQGQMVKDAQYGMGGNTSSVNIFSV